jgi:hypothetical protein
MARTTPRPPHCHPDLEPMLRHCPCCGETLGAAYHNYRTITTLDTVVRLTLQIWCCLTHACPHFQKPYRPEAKGRLALSKHEFGLDVLTFVGNQRYTHHRSLPAIHQALVARGVVVASHTVRNLTERYDALVVLSLQDPARLQRLIQPQGRVILARNGLQPDVGHEVLWGLRDGMPGQVLLTRSLLWAPQDDLAELLEDWRR